MPVLPPLKSLSAYLRQDYIYILLLGSIELPVNKWHWNDNYNGNSMFSLQSRKFNIVPQINIICYSSSQDSSFGSIMLK